MEKSGLRKRMSVWAAFLFCLLVINSPVFASDCGEIVPDKERPLQGYFGYASAYPYIRGQIYDTVTDSKGLMWQAQPLDVMQDWEAACYYCDNLDFADKEDWRLPTVAELESLVDYSFTETKIDTSFFTVEDGLYWSSSVPAAHENNAWVVSFEDGQTSITDKTGDMYVMCVRDAPNSLQNTLEIELHAELVNTLVLFDSFGNSVTTDGENFLDVGDKPEGTIGSRPLIPQGTAASDGYIYFEVIGVKKNGVALDVNNDLKPVDKMDYIWSVDNESVS
ncbi:MAG: DUF1566 domain-containing protein, partial [Desulfamplus sp.]|nr:DUF1566 domain-containing protein [Desulfamplus sp.]